MNVSNPRREYPPDDHLIALGKLAFQSAKLDFNIQILIWVMAGIWPVSTGYAGALTIGMNTSALRRTIETLAFQLWFNSPDIEKQFTKLADSYGKHCSRRGDLVHAFWITEFPGHPRAFQSRAKSGKGIVDSINQVSAKEILDSVERARRLVKDCQRLTKVAAQGREDFVRSLQETIAQQAPPKS